MQFTGLGYYEQGNFKLYSTCPLEHKGKHLLGVSPGGELLSGRVGISSALVHASKRCYQTVVPKYVPTSSTPHSHQHLLVYVFFFLILAILVGI